MYNTKKYYAFVQVDLVTRRLGIVSHLLVRKKCFEQKLHSFQGDIGYCNLIVVIFPIEI